MRTYGEVIDVRTARPEGFGPGGMLPDDGLSGGSAAPAQFLWRGRLYLVREVLAHWVELGAWWSLPRRVDAPPAGRSVGPPTAPGHAPEGDRPPRSVAADVGAVEREVWRVEAATGRSASSGVYDLARDVPAPDPDPRAPGPSPGAPARWRLARALD